MFNCYPIGDSYLQWGNGTFSTLNLNIPFPVVLFSVFFQGNEASSKKEVFEKH